MDNKIQSEEIFSSTSELRKRGGIEKQTIKLPQRRKITDAEERNGCETNKPAYTSQIIFQNTMPSTETTSKVTSVLTHLNRNGGALTNRRFSESSADEVHRCEESFKHSIRNKNMALDGSVHNYTKTLHSNRKSCPRFHCEDIDERNGCCHFGWGYRKKRISDAIDIGIRVMLVFIFISLETAKPFKRKLHPEEMWLYKNPRTPDIVSAQALLLSVIFGPLFVTIFHLWLTGDRRDFRAASWVWTLALGLNGLATSLLKITVGRHRPDFFYRCFPDGVVVLNNVTQLHGSMDYYNCTGDIRHISEGRKSFPSGHASFAFVGFGFIAIYICAKMHAMSARGRGQSWRLCVAVLPLILATLIAVSRTCDYHHHWEDVSAGSVIGLICVYLVYRQYYPSLSSINCHQPYLRICHRRNNSTKELYSQSEGLLSEDNISNDDNYHQAI